MNHVPNQARLATFQENSDIIKAVQQISTLDNRTTDICIAYNNQMWDVETLEPIDGAPAFNGGPPRHFNCRSTLVPVTKSFEELGIDATEQKGTRASMDGQVPDDITFDQYLEGKSREFQDELLGERRAELWRQDRITLQQLVDQRGRPLTVEELENLADVVGEALSTADWLSTQPRMTAAGRVNARGAYTSVPFPVEETDFPGVTTAIVQQGSRVDVVRLADLIATQPTVKISQLQNAKLSSRDGLPVVVRRRGRLYIWDGHHRLARAKLEGQATARVRVVEAN
jgi:hypothetical protein